MRVRLGYVRLGFGGKVRSKLVSKVAGRKLYAFMGYQTMLL